MTLCDDIKSLEFFVFKKHKFALLLYVCIMYVGMYLGGSIIDLYSCHKIIKVLRLHEIIGFELMYVKLQAQQNSYSCVRNMQR